MGGSKSQTSTQTTTIPPEVLARYNSVNATAEKVAANPFQEYSTDPNQFVAPMNATQNAGVANTNAAANQAQPYFAGATGLTLAGAGPTNVGNVSGGQIAQYMNPYVQSVVKSTSDLLNQQEQQQQSGQTGNAINSGAFGGDRAGIAAANLAGQQELSRGNVLSGVLNTGYNTALSTAQQQQGFDLSQQQANLARMGQAGTQLAGLGAGAQSAALQGAQAQLGAGAQEQQTQQAGLSALYNQFLQQQAYPFQTAQFLANIAEGTGSLSGSTTTTTQPAPFFSDERLKDDIEDIGRTHDGQKIVKFRYKGEKGPRQIGLLAQDVEKHHPEAVGLAHGYKTVDYDKATEDAAGMGEGLGRRAYAMGGSPTPSPYLDLYGLPGGGASRIPPQILQQGQQSRGLMKHGSAPSAPPSELQQIMSAVNTGKGAVGAFDDVKGAWNGLGKAWDSLSNDNTPGAGIPHFARGGLASGGMPFEGEGLDIPDVENDHKGLQTPNAPQGQQQSGAGQALGAVKSVAGLGSSLMSLLGLFLSQGGSVGREHHADGDTVGNPDGSMPQQGLDIDGLIRASAQKYGVPENIVRAVAMQESGLNPRAIGDNGQAIGTMQVQKRTAADPGFGVDPIDPNALHDPATNIDFGTHYFAARAKHAGVNNWDDPAQRAKGIAAYNGGGDPDYANHVLAHIGQSAPSGGSDMPVALASSGNDVGMPSGDNSSGIMSKLGDAASGTGNWFEKNQNWLVPLLSGVGAMASSPSRYLGAAMLQGLGGGAQAYQRQQYQQSEIAKNTFGLAAQRFTPVGQGMFYDRVVGDTVPVDVYQSRLSSMPGVGQYVSGPQAGRGTNQNAARPAGLATVPAPTPVPAPSDKAVISPASVTSGPASEGKPVENNQPAPVVNPLVAMTQKVYDEIDQRPEVKTLHEQAQKLMSDAQNYEILANDPANVATGKAATYLSMASNSRNQAQTALSQWKDVRDKYATPAMSALTENAKTNYGVQNTAKVAAYNEAREGQQTLSQINAMMNVMFDPKTGKPMVNSGPLGAKFNNAAALMQQAGFSQGLIQQFLGTNPNNAQELEKLKTALGSEIANQEMNGAPVRVTEFNRFLASTPGQDMLPGAFKWIADNVIKPKAMSQVNAVKTIRNLDPSKDDIMGALFDYRNENPWYGAPKNTNGQQGDNAGAFSQPNAPAGGNQEPVMITGPDDIKKLAKGTRFIVPYGPSKGQIKVVN